MKVQIVLLPLLCALLLLSGCGGPSVEQTRQDRVEASLARLDATPGGKMLAEAIAAHGGLEAWFSRGDLQFRWIYRMKDRGPEAVVNTLQTIDLWSARAVHEVPDSPVRFGWTGEEAWIHPADAEFSPPPHFWSLTPYYFVGVPFVLADPGTNHEALGEIEFEGVRYPQVKVTFDSGTGESPDDYYIVLIDPETKRVRAVRYIVTDGKVSPEGPSPEKLLTYEGYRDIDGILLPSGHRSFAMTDGVVGEEIRDALMEDVAFLPHEEGRFAVPEGAKTY